MIGYIFWLFGLRIDGKTIGSSSHIYIATLLKTEQEKKNG